MNTRYVWECENCGWATNRGLECADCGEAKDTAVLDRDALAGRVEELEGFLRCIEVANADTPRRLEWELLAQRYCDEVRATLDALADALARLDRLTQGAGK